MSALVGAFFGYALFNFVYTNGVLNAGGQASMLEGKRVLQSHGKVLKELSAEAFNAHRAYSLRGFSGHWLVFFSLSMTELYSKLNAPAAELNQESASRIREADPETHSS